MDILNDTIEMNRRIMVLKTAYYEEWIESMLDKVEIIDDCTAKVQSEDDPTRFYQVNYVKGICQCPSFGFSENNYCKHIDLVRRKVEIKCPN